MNTRDRNKVSRFRNMLRAAVKHPAIIAKLPLVGLAEVWAHDGKAYVFPGSGGGLIVRDWFQTMRHIRRHR